MMAAAEPGAAPDCQKNAAIGCTTPLLLGLYSLVAVFALALYPDGRVPLQTTAWYPKLQATFADVLAAVRLPCGDGSISQQLAIPRCWLFPEP